MSRARSGLLSEMYSKIDLPVSRLPLYECGARVFSHLLFPDDNESAQRIKAELVICNLTIKAQARHDLKWGYTVQSIKPSHLLVSEDDISWFLRIYRRRLRDRIVAAKMILPIIDNKFDSILQSKPFTKSDVPSISHQAETMRDALGEKSALNIISRIWAPSIPVLHVAAALTAARDLQINGDLPSEVFSMSWHDMTVFRFSIKLADTFRIAITQIPKFERVAWRLSRFELS